MQKQMHMTRRDANIQLTFELTWVWRLYWYTRR